MTTVKNSKPREAKSNNVDEKALKAVDAIAPDATNIPEEIEASTTELADEGVRNLDPLDVEREMLSGEIHNMVVMKDRLEDSIAIANDAIAPHVEVLKGMEDEINAARLVVNRYNEAQNHVDMLRDNIGIYKRNLEKLRDRLLKKEKKLEQIDLRRNRCLNGITRPRQKSLAGKFWEEFDAIAQSAGHPSSASAIKKEIPTPIPAAKEKAFLNWVQYNNLEK